MARDLAGREQRHRQPQQREGEGRAAQVHDDGAAAGDAAHLLDDGAILGRAEVMKEQRREGPVDGTVAKGQRVGHGGDAELPVTAAPSRHQVRELGIDADDRERRAGATRRPCQGSRHLAAAGAQVEERLDRRRAAQPGHERSPHRSDPEQPVIDPLEIGERALPRVGRELIAVEELGSQRGRPRERHRGRL